MVAPAHTAQLLPTTALTNARAACPVGWRVLAWTIVAVSGCIPPIPVVASTLGVYGGTDQVNVTRFEKWLGCPVQQILIFTDLESWSGIAHPEWFIGRFAALNKPALWSIAMIPPGSSLEVAATGAYNAHYVSAARALARARPDPEGAIRVRLGWELNGDWFPWAAAGRERAFIATYRHIVELLQIRQQQVPVRVEYQLRPKHGPGNGVPRRSVCRRDRRGFLLEAAIHGH